MNILMKITNLAEVLREQVGHWFDLRDAFWMIGLASVTYGISQIYIPTAWIVLGAALFWMGVKR